MKNDKSKTTAYLLWLFVGAFGGHRFYLGRIKTGCALVGLFVLGIAASAAGSFYMMWVMESGDEILTLATTVNPFTILTYTSLVLILVWIGWFLLDLFLINSMINKDRANMIAVSVASAEDVFE